MPTPTLTPATRFKVLAYVLWGGNLLVFRQPLAPEAGLQVPAGTVEPGEDPRRAVLREVWEETGLRAPGRPRLLGRRRFDARPYGRQEVHRRAFFVLELADEPPERWRHWERHCSDGSDPMPYDLTWHDLRAGPPDLAAEQGALLPRLLGWPEGGPQRQGRASATRR